MKEKKKFGLESQDYEAPRAESVEIVYNMLLCVSGSLEAFGEEREEGVWDGTLNP